MLDSTHIRRKKSSAVALKGKAYYFSTISLYRVLTPWFHLHIVLLLSCWGHHMKLFNVLQHKVDVFIADFKLGMAAAEAAHEDMCDPEHPDLIDMDESERKIYA